MMSRRFFIRFHFIKMHFYSVRGNLHCRLTTCKSCTDYINMHLFIIRICCFSITASLCCTEQCRLFAFFLEENSSALRALLVCWLIPTYKITLGIVGAAVKNSFCLCTLDNDIATALWTLNTRFFYILNDVFTFRVSGAGNKFTVSADFNNHLTTALVTDNISFVFF